MGIEVWLLRSEPVAEESTSGSSEPIAVEDQSMVQRQSPATNPGVIDAGQPTNVTNSSAADEKTSTAEVARETEPPEFLFCFLDYEKITLMMSLPSEVSALPNDYRNFGDDVYLAIIEQRKIPGIRDLRWPMVQSAHIKQTTEDARQVVGQNVRQSCDHLIVFGDTALNFIVDSTEDRMQQNRLSIAGKSMLIVRDVAHYFEHPQYKKELWQNLSDFRRDLGK